MATERELRRLEKDITIKMSLIKSKKMTPSNSGIGKLLNILKVLDEPSYENLLNKYKEILKSLK